MVARDIYLIQGVCNMRKTLGHDFNDRNNFVIMNSLNHELFSRLKETDRELHFIKKSMKLKWIGLRLFDWLLKIRNT